jgi:hypothetical protein
MTARVPGDMSLPMAPADMPETTAFHSGNDPSLLRPSTRSRMTS